MCMMQGRRRRRTMQLRCKLQSICAKGHRRNNYYPILLLFLLLLLRLHDAWQALRCVALLCLVILILSLSPQIQTHSSSEIQSQPSPNIGLDPKVTVVDCGPLQTTKIRAHFICIQVSTYATCFSQPIGLAHASTSTNQLPHPQRRRRPAKCPRKHISHSTSPHASSLSLHCHTHTYTDNSNSLSHRLRLQHPNRTHPPAFSTTATTTTHTLSFPTHKTLPLLFHGDPISTSSSSSLAQNTTNNPQHNMSPTSPSSPQSHTPNLSVARARQSLARRKRSAKSSQKPSDPLELLAVVVGASRTSSKFVCPICTSTFGRRCERKRHVAEVHTLAGARRFVCKHPSCAKSFTRKDALAKHEIVKHQGKRRFVCPTCSEKFTSRYDLTRHNVRVHSSVKKRFTCEFCAAGFSQKSQLTMHKGRVHTHPNTPTSTQNSSKSSSQPATHPRRTSMDSLAAAAVAIAEEEEKAANRRRLVHKPFPISHSTTSGPPSHNREAEDFHSSAHTHSRNIDEAKAAAFNADALLEAAAVLHQPYDGESSFTTNLTDATRMECSTSAEDSDDEHVNRHL